MEKLNNADVKYRHFKGGIYEVICHGVLESDPENPDCDMIVYRGQDGKIWIRPAYEFHGYKNGVRRFELIED